MARIVESNVIPFHPAIRRPVASPVIRGRPVAGFGDDTTASVAVTPSAIDVGASAITSIIGGSSNIVPVPTAPAPSTGPSWQTWALLGAGAFAVYWFFLRKKGR